MDDPRFLGWFLGPKGELGEDFEQMVVTVLRDYVHWRRNYFPEDPPMLQPSQRRGYADEIDPVHSIMADLSARLRRNFPFYSPRYIGHQLSDVLLPATVGYFAGMLYNPNNVTPEAAPVTVELEVEATNTILSMLGYTAPPELPKRIGKETEKYERALRREFGWCHLTSGGTIANIEALWAARLVRYFPLAAQEAAQAADVCVEVRFPNPNDSTKPIIEDLRDVDPLALFSLRTNECIYLLPRLISAVTKDESQREIDRAQTKVDRLLSKSKYAPSGNLANAFMDFPPALIAPATAHYSIQKAASVLGIGRANVHLIEVDENFRMSIPALRETLDRLDDRRVIPFAVVAVAGSTEEGAVDPIHQICSLRREREVERKASFWVHTDAAWAGFLRVLFEPNSLKLAGVCDHYGARIEPTVGRTTLGLHDSIKQAQSRLRVSPDAEGQRTDDATQADLDGLLSRLADTAPNDLAGVSRLVSDLATTRIPAPVRLPPGRVQQPGAEKRNKLISEFVRTEATFGLDIAQAKDLRSDPGTDGEPGRASEPGDRPDPIGPTQRRVISWGHNEVLDAFAAFPESDSITVDPHKMGYLPYPSGMVAFRNDRVRHYMQQKAQYITSADGSALLHRPVQHIRGDENGSPSAKARDSHGVPWLRSEIDAFAPYTLEGSRPGAAAASLWATLKVVSPDWFGYGGIVKSSLLAARTLYEWIGAWPRIAEEAELPMPYRLVPLLPKIPDTNIVTFVVTPAGPARLTQINKLTTDVYRRFSIDAERGDRSYSYGQEFFLSHTSCKADQYSFRSMEPFLRRADVRDMKRGYSSRGVEVLRAVVMSPFIQAMADRSLGDVLGAFMLDLHRAAVDGSGPQP